ncbi:hypothetical protein [Umezawaea sp.]|uniref:hypothetical protein n=1 Tax=Umezawaea sp. TaxID=1955258 RepID=UPI002ED0A658
MEGELDDVSGGTTELDEGDELDVSDGGVLGGTFVTCCSLVAPPVCVTTTSGAAGAPVSPPAGPAALRGPS